MEHNTQFTKHQIIFCETFGVCEVAEITNLAPKKGEPILYYKLQSVFKAKKAHIYLFLNIRPCYENYL